MRMHQSSKKFAGLALVLATLISLAASGLANSTRSGIAEYQVKLYSSSTSRSSWNGRRRVSKMPARLRDRLLGTDPFDRRLKARCAARPSTGEARHRALSQCDGDPALPDSVISRSEAAHIGEISTALAGHGILTVSDIEDRRSAA